MTRPGRPRFAGAAAALALVLALPACASRRGPSPPALPAELAPDSFRTEIVSPGVRHSYLWIEKGPWAIHLVEVDPRACGVEMRTVKGGDRLVGREPTRAMAERVSAALGRPVLAAINADFFSFEPPGVPEGPQVLAGEVLKGQGTHREAVEDRRVREQPVFGVGEDGRAFIADAALQGSVYGPGGTEAAIGGVNTRPRESLTLYTPLAGEATPVDTGVVEVVVRRLPAAERQPSRGVVVQVDTAAAGVALRPDGVVLAGRGPAASVLPRLSPGDTVAWRAGFSGVRGGVREMVGGFPLLLRRGQSALESIAGLRPPFSDVRHPRAAVGLRPDGTVVLLAVDGRQPGYSEGMSLVELRDFMRALGTPDALNLDGGGSTTLVLDGAIVNRPSDATGERPVANALLVLGPRTGECRR